MEIVLVAGGKGGVGKSTVAYMFAQSLSRNQKVLLLDFDICGPSVGVLTGIQTERVFPGVQGLTPLHKSDNLHFLSISAMISESAAVIWRAPKKAALLKLFLASIDPQIYQYVVIDMPPGITDEHLFAVTNLPTARALIVTTSQNLALEEALSTITFFQSHQIAILGVIENMRTICCTNCGTRNAIFSTEGGQLLAEEAGVPYLGHIEFLPAHPEQTIPTVIAQLTDQIEHNPTTAQDIS
ncbi:hypothetical protein NEHOM01_1140 [Nematocida homosporus]|uniref:uncharacterized protein n=1 Tax=Nematocida homosporus TaxID=1912981 RepID=UPI00221F9BC9|nr:uncharacterized protein NEHOM01_1140 [Nematocida homosporus]KAI5185890.1 hypothetical protein NEHOM01_1140 [Nematocida homosporus]